jgi:hypothetical protein
LIASRGEREEKREGWAEMRTGESEKRSLGGFQIRASRDLRRRVPFTRTVSMDPSLVMLPPCVYAAPVVYGLDVGYDFKSSDTKPEPHRGCDGSTNQVCVARCRIGRRSKGPLNVNRCMAV